MATRWGIVGAGKISHDFATALETLPREEHELVAIASSRKSKAKKFAEIHGIPKAYGCYRSMAKNENVEVVYIGTLTPSHFKLCKMMMGAGKNVLCEKPLTMNLRQSLELVQLSITTKVFFMENVWSRCTPVYEVLMNEIKRGTIGQVKHVTAGFGKKRNFADRTVKKFMGGGATLGLAGDAIQFALLVYNHARPSHCKAQAILDENEVDVLMSTMMVFEDDRLASLYVHDPLGPPDEALVIGTAGMISVPHFWCPTVICVHGETMTFPLPEPKHELNYQNSIGMRYAAAEVRECLKKGFAESPKIANVDSLAVAEIQDIMRKQIGVRYSVDPKPEVRPS